MPRFYQHRVNTVEALEGLPNDLGVEFDLRSDGDRVIVTHDPFTDGPPLAEYLAHVGARPCIFNIKCEGIEEHCLTAARRAGVEDLFLLDVTMPAAVRLARTGERRFAVRWSEHEPAEASLAWCGVARWLWVDCFTRWPSEVDAWQRLAEHFSVCLVSPELQGHGQGSIGAWRDALEPRSFDAVCTKRPDLWRTTR